MPATMARLVITMGRARSRQASSSASRWLMPLALALDGVFDQQDRVLRGQAHQHQEADQRRDAQHGTPSSSARNAPPTAVGSAIMMITGLKKLRNNNTITR